MDLDKLASNYFISIWNSSMWLRLLYKI